MKKVFMSLFLLLAVTPALSLAGQGNLKAVYDDSGKKLDYVQRLDTGEKLVIDSPLWLVLTEDDGLISSVGFVPSGGKGKAAVSAERQPGRLNRSECCNSASEFQTPPSSYPTQKQAHPAPGS